MSKSQKFGIDCGATKVMAQSVIYDSKSQIIKPAGLNFEYNYSDCSFWNPNFIPIPLEIQKAELENGVFDIKKTERMQASAIVKIIKQLISKLRSKDIALCYPGLKSRSGIILMANGPRIPDLIEQIPEIKTIYHDSECCLLGEINSVIGRIKHSKNTIYIGGGTGIADGLILNNEISKDYSYNFTVKRIGIESLIYNFANNFPLIYGFTSLIIALIIGWISADLFRRFRKA